MTLKPEEIKLLDRFAGVALHSLLATTSQEDREHKSWPTLEAYEIALFMLGERRDILTELEMKNGRYRDLVDLGDFE